LDALREKCCQYLVDARSVFAYSGFIIVKFLVRNQTKVPNKIRMEGASNYSEVAVMPKSGKNIYKRKDGRWEGRYPKYRDSNGKTIYGSVYGKSCTEAKQRLAAIISAEPLEKPCSIILNAPIITFADVAAQWLSVASLKVKPSTYAGYTSTLNLHILPHLGDNNVQTMTTLVINHFSIGKLEGGRRDGKGGLSSKTVRDMLSIIKSIMDFAWGEKLIPYRLAIAYPKYQQQTMRVLSRQEQTTLEAVLTADIDIHKLGILLCLYTGIRIGEAITWGKPLILPILSSASRKPLTQ